MRSVDIGTETFTPPADLDPVALLEEHLATGWEYDVEIHVDAPLDVAARCLPRSLGRLEPIDASTTRLVGSTSNPYWYAEQLAVLPSPFHIVRCPELRETVRALGRRLLAAAEPEPTRER